MVTEDHDRIVPERAHETQRLERLRAAIHQVADEPQPVAIGGEPYPGEERPQLITAALDVADGIAAHCRIPGIASRKGAMGASKCWPSASTIW